MSARHTRGTGRFHTRTTGGNRQAGFALISGLLLLLVVTIMAVSLFRSYGIQQKISGSVREKNRALSAAVSAQQYAEWWLSSQTPPVAGGCTGFVNSLVGQICSTPLNDFTAVPWSSGVTFTPFNASITVTTTSPVQGSYYATPVFYITDLGPNPGAAGEIYQVDAAGWGGTSNTVSVVESTYLLSPAAWSADK
jgi:type IV pilus assembly protein PilX